MKKLLCVIVEDDVISQTILEQLVEKTGLLELSGKFGSADEAIPWLMNNHVDLLFLDIEMPGMTGLDMLRSLSYRPDVVVVSSKPDYAIHAFDLSVVDYLMKPVKDYSRFLSAINKVINKKNNSKAIASADDSLFVKIDSMLLNIGLTSILWIEAFGDYVKIHTSEKTHTVYATLKKIEDKLDKNKFVRVHRSYVVNVSKITNIDPNNLEINKKIIPISGSYKDDLLNKISVL